MVIGTIEIENKADRISISYMAYCAKKGSRFFRRSLSVAELDQPNWEGTQELWADLGATIPIVLVSPVLSLPRDHEGDEGAVTKRMGVQRSVP